MESPIKTTVRAVASLMRRRQRETIVVGAFYVGRGDRFDDDRRRVRCVSSPESNSGDVRTHQRKDK
jgi:hypothetical protein